jgi:hypothetical protein
MIAGVVMSLDVVSRDLAVNFNFTYTSRSSFAVTKCDVWIFVVIELFKIRPGCILKY